MPCTPLLQNYPKSHTYSSLHPFIGEQSMVCSQGKVWAKQVSKVPQTSFKVSHTSSFNNVQSLVNQGYAAHFQFARGKEAHQSSLKCSPHAEEGILTWLPVCGKSNAYWNRVSFLKRNI